MGVSRTRGLQRTQIPGKLGLQEIVSVPTNEGAIRVFSKPAAP